MSESTVAESRACDPTRASPTISSRLATHAETRLTMRPIGDIGWMWPNEPTGAGTDGTGRSRGASGSSEMSGRMPGKRPTKSLRYLRRSTSLLGLARVSTLEYYAPRVDCDSTNAADRRDDGSGSRQGRSLRLHMFPLRDGTGDDLEQRVHRRHCNFKVSTVDNWTATPQFLQKPAPFVQQLTIRGGNALNGGVAAKFGLVELVATRLCLRANHGEVPVDGGARRRARPESGQLRMVPVALGAAAQDFAGEQRFSPKGDETLCIEVLGMKSPESHGIAAA
jgi:hypothetical protein